LLRGAETVGVAGAVIVAGQKRAVLLAQAGPVVGRAGADLWLALGDARVEDSGEGVSRWF
jgi:hypothetical protein